MKRKFLILLVLLLSSIVVAQDENIISQEEWEYIRDKYADAAILLLARMDTLNAKIDSLKAVLEYVKNFDYEQELYKSIGSSKEEVSRFRSKFEYTENRINKREGTPQDARNMYFDEIAASKLRCLPEFKDRYYAMSMALTDMFAGNQVKTTDAHSYTVAEGDNLQKIAAEKYGDKNLWLIVWDANKKEILNPDDFISEKMKKITNPNKIYPGQKLFIPSEPVK